MRSRQIPERLIKNPERSLWAEVLRLAIKDVVKGPMIDGATAEVRDRERAKMLRWLTTPSRDLEMVCDLAGVEMEALIEMCRSKRSDRH